MNIRVYKVILTALSIPPVLAGFFVLVSIWLYLLAVHPVVKILECILMIPKDHKIGRPALNPIELYKRMTGIY